MILKLCYKAQQKNIIYRYIVPVKEGSYQEVARVLLTNLT